MEYAQFTHQFERKPDLMRPNSERSPVGCRRLRVIASAATDVAALDQSTKQAWLG
jgi:hypothetical protein